ncbi:MAG TPA: AlpA family phage regulatory protein [Bordetella sp.]|nr:AlpA family phage regulatory protein [Bordetella sp.]
MMSEPLLYRMRDLVQTVGMSKPTIYRKIKVGEFPRPVRLFKGSDDVAWRAEDIRAWIAGLPVAGSESDRE